MFEIKHLKGNTYYYDAFTNVGIYKLNDKEAVLIDSCDHKRMVKGLDRELSEMGLSVSLIKSTNPFYGIQPSETEIITEDNIPEGFEIISLSGHGFDMIGVRTPDDVLFLADSVISVSTWENYKLPFFHNVNKAMATLSGIKDIKAALFLPSHNPPVEDIAELAEYNLEKLKEKKRMILELCENKSFEELFDLTMKREELEIKMPKYCMYAVMVKNLLQSLIEDDLIYTDLDNNRIIYRKK